MACQFRDAIGPGADLSLKIIAPLSDNTGDFMAGDDPKEAKAGANFLKTRAELKWAFLGVLIGAVSPGIKDVSCAIHQVDTGELNHRGFSLVPDPT